MIAMKALAAFTSEGVSYQAVGDEFSVTSKAMADRLEGEGVAKRILPANRSKAEDASPQ